MNILKLMTFVIILQIIYSFGITTYMYAITNIDSSQAGFFNDYSKNLSSVEDISQKVSSGVDKQYNVPTVDLAMLVVYSGNIVVDLIFNFIFAIPQMVMLFLNGIGIFLNIPLSLFSQVKAVIYIVISVLYYINIIIFLINVRSRGGLV